MRILQLFFVLTMITNVAVGQQTTKSAWVDSTYKYLSLDERIGQLFMLRAFSHIDKKHISELEASIKKYKVGGLCFFQGSPQYQAKLVNQYQALVDIPLLMAIDGEWGVGMRFKDQVVSFPRQLMLGAIQNDNLLYEMGKEVAFQCKKIGIHVNFAPVADVNNNPDNPVINDRSFGEDMYNVSAKSFAYMKGMQDNGILACAKHFPGHGDTDVDSHLGLPIINHSLERLDSLELTPFRVLAGQGIASMMVAHLHTPAFDNRKNRPTTLSENVIKNVLRKQLNYNGLVFTDAMEMKGVLNHFPAGIAEAEALLAGNDMIVLPTEIEKSIKTIKTYIDEGKISMDQIKESVKRILGSKYDVGLHKGHTTLYPSIVDGYLNRPESKVLKSKLVKASITLAKDSTRKLPITDISKITIATVSIGTKTYTPFQSRVSDYAAAKHFKINKDINQKKRSQLLKTLNNYDKVIVSIHDMEKLSSKSYGISDSTLVFLDILQKQNDVVTILFGSPYALSKIGKRDQVIVAYNEEELTQDITAQAIFGALGFRGKLPVSAGEFYKFGDGELREEIGRMGYDIPESVGLSSDTLAAIDTIIDEMVMERAAPGCQVLIAKDGKIIFDKSYGYFTYKKQNRVDKNSIYDVASVTKILASTISVMKLEEEGKLNLKDRVSKYVPQLDTTNKKDMVFDQMMAHHAQLIGWIPFYINTVSGNKRNPKPLPKYYERKGSSKYSTIVANHLYMRSDYRDTIWSKIYSSKLRERKGYRYSDLAFYLVHDAIKNLTEKGVDQYADEKFYKPLGLSKTGFNPRLKQSNEKIVPSEEDIYFRKQRLQGYVHDMGAAMLGGVSGHAGLFSTSKELAIMMQMLLNDGYYGGKKYLEKETIQKYTTRYSESTRRGIGFDMKELNPDRSPNMSELASDSTFGHTGFTGAAVFADPEHNIVYVFLSNRTYPRMENTKFIRNEYRPRVQSVIYKAMKKELFH